MKNTLLALLILALSACNSPQYDLVIKGGRVLDPETELDAIRNIGIQGGKIVAISDSALSGADTIDAAGKVVAPGFIDLHQHGDSQEVYKAKIHDGVTSALELEIGVEDIPAWYAERENVSPLNFGATISHPDSRRLAMDGKVVQSRLSGEWVAQPMTSAQIEGMKLLLAKGLEQGAVGIGMLLAYTPGATPEEVDAIFDVAAKHNAACYVHMRTNHQNLDNLNEVLLPAKRAGAQLHIVHMNSSGRDRAPEYLAAIRAAQAEGVDVTTECYPYNRGSNYIDSNAYDNWQEMTDEQIGQHIYVETGENLTRETFAKYHPLGGLVISPADYSEAAVEGLVADPMVMIASDGMWLTNGKAHPRTFGTYARVLGRYVREKKLLSLMDAIRKMTLLPADRLAKRIPSMKQKGRLQTGADADIVVFNPETIIDQATYQDPAQYSTGINDVIVNGRVTVRNGDFVEGAAGGQPIRAAQRKP